MRDLYRTMVLIRRFEDRVYHLFLDGEIPGTLHQYQGQHYDRGNYDVVEVHRSIVAMSSSGHRGRVVAN